MLGICFSVVSTKDVLGFLSVYFSREIYTNVGICPSVCQ